MKTFLTLSLIIVMFFGAFSFVFAQDAIDNAVDRVERGFGNNTVTGGSTPDVKTREVIGKVINYALGIIGTFSLIVFIYSGIMWMLAGGDANMVTKAQDTMIWAALGLFVVFISYTIITYLIGKFVF